MGELWNVYCEYFGEYWLCHDGTALCIEMFILLMKGYFPVLFIIHSDSIVVFMTSPSLCRRSRKAELLSSSHSSVFQKKSQSALRYANQLQVDRCPDCNAILEQYDEDTISMCIVALGTFIHREPSLAAPLLVDTLKTVARYSAVIRCGGLGVSQYKDVVLPV